MKKLHFDNSSPFHSKLESLVLKIASENQIENAHQVRIAINEEGAVVEFEEVWPRANEEQNEDFGKSIEEIGRLDEYVVDVKEIQYTDPLLIERISGTFKNRKFTAVAEWNTETNNQEAIEAQWEDGTAITGQELDDLSKWIQSYVVKMF